VKPAYGCLQTATFLIWDS